MKNKILYVAATLSVVIAGVLMASDQLGQFTSAVKNATGSRWQLSRQASVVITNAATINLTNVVLASPGIVGQIVWVPGDIGDKFELHTATTAAATSVANEIFVVNNSTNSTAGVPVGYPQTFNFMTTPLDATNGIVCVVKPATTASVSRVFISFDINR